MLRIFHPLLLLRVGHKVPEQRYRSASESAGAYLSDSLHKINNH